MYVDVISSDLYISVVPRKIMQTKYSHYKCFKILQIFIYSSLHFPAN